LDGQGLKSERKDLSEDLKARRSLRKEGIQVSAAVTE
jgi:hypothetical protein